MKCKNLSKITTKISLMLLAVLTLFTFIKPNIKANANTLSSIYFFDNFELVKGFSDSDVQMGTLQLKQDVSNLSINLNTASNNMNSLYVLSYYENDKNIEYFNKDFNGNYFNMSSNSRNLQINSNSQSISMLYNLAENIWVFSLNKSTFPNNIVANQFRMFFTLDIKDQYVDYFDGSLGNIKSEYRTDILSTFNSFKFELYSYVDYLDIQRQNDYDDGFNDGLLNDLENQEIYDIGYSSGVADGLEQGKQEGFNDGYSKGSDIGFSSGYQQGVNESHKGFKGLMLVPASILGQLFRTSFSWLNFTVLGINLWSIIVLMSSFSLLLLFIKMFLGR